MLPLRKNVTNNFAVLSADNYKPHEVSPKLTQSDLKSGQANPESNEKEVLNDNISRSITIKDITDNQNQDNHIKEISDDIELIVEQNTGTINKTDDVNKEVVQIYTENSDNNMHIQHLDNKSNSNENEDENNKYETKMHILLGNDYNIKSLVNNNTEMENLPKADSVVGIASIKKNCYTYINEFQNFLSNYNNNNAITDVAANMSLSETVDLLGIENENQDKMAGIKLQTTNHTSMNYAQIPRSDVLVMTPISNDGEYSENNKTICINTNKNNFINSLNTIENNKLFTKTNEIINDKGNANENNFNENTLDVLMYEIGSTGPNKNIEFIDKLSEQSKQILDDEDMFQDILDLEANAFLARDKILSENRTNENGLSDVTTKEIQDIQELARPPLLWNYNEEKIDGDSTSKFDSDNCSDNLSKNKVDEETLNNNNIEDLLTSTLEDNLDFITIPLSCDDENEEEMSQKSSKASKNTTENDTINVNTAEDKNVQNVINNHSTISSENSIAKDLVRISDEIHNTSRFIVTDNKDIQSTSNNTTVITRSKFSCLTITDVLSTKACSNFTKTSVGYKNFDSNLIIPVREQVKINRISISRKIRRKNIANKRHRNTINRRPIHRNTVKFNTKSSSRKKLSDKRDNMLSDNYKPANHTNSINNVKKLTIDNIERNTVNTIGMKGNDNICIRSHTINKYIDKEDKNIAIDKVDPLINRDNWNIYTQNNINDFNKKITDEKIVKEHTMKTKHNVINSKYITDYMSALNNDSKLNEMNLMEQQNNEYRVKIQDRLNTFANSAGTSKKTKSTETRSTSENISEICNNSPNDIQHEKFENVIESDSDYNSSDFEFISEEDAKTDLLIDKTIDRNHYDVGMVKWWNRCLTSNRSVSGLNRFPGPPHNQNRHVIPQGEAFLRLFRENVYNPIYSNIHILEIKSSRLSKNCNQFTCGGRFWREESPDKNLSEEAKKTNDLILTMHPNRNRHVPKFRHNQRRRK